MADTKAVKLVMASGEDFYIRPELAMMVGPAYGPSSIKEGETIQLDGMVIMHTTIGKLQVRGEVDDVAEKVFDLMPQRVK